MQLKLRLSSLHLHPSSLQRSTIQPPHFIVAAQREHDFMLEQHLQRHQRDQTRNAGAEPDAERRSISLK